jgi:alpha-mannosidase
VSVRDIGLTVLRSPIYAHHIPTQPQPDRDYSYIDQGMQTFTYSLLPHAGSWETAGTVRRAAELNQRPVVLLGTFHAGPLPLSRAHVEASPDTILIGAVKQAEDNDDLIMRCVETSRVATGAEIRVGDRVIAARFGPCEIKTLRVPRDAAQPALETDLLELEDRPLP